MVHPTFENVRLLVSQLDNTPYNHFTFDIYTKFTDPKKSQPQPTAKSTQRILSIYELKLVAKARNIMCRKLFMIALAMHRHGHVLLILH